MLMRSAALSQTASEARKSGGLVGVCDCHVVQLGLAVAEVAQQQGFTFHRGLFCCLNVRAERCTDAPANSIFSSPITHLLSMLYGLTKILSHAGTKKKTKGLEGFRFRSFIGRFPVTSWQ